MTVRKYDHYKRGGYRWIFDSWPDHALQGTCARACEFEVRLQTMGEVREGGAALALASPWWSPLTTEKEVPAHRILAALHRGHCKANRRKPSGIESKEVHIAFTLEPRFASKRLDEFPMRISRH